MIGKKINNYTIEKLLGEGGMGNVYLARHGGMDRKVAIKAILPELVSKEEVKKRFLVEASTMSKLQHQSIVTLYDYVSNEDGLFLIMEFVDGIQLDEYMKKLGKPIEEELAIEFTKQVVSACNHAHERGVVHRDIKPQNVMITSGGEVKILDFGIAKMMDDEVNNLTK
ncbi:MAG: serine/threonine-protein kinase, partial [Crocinitomicaceae bacterium]|nr:serine/threonine-protein kinase [Crocinitomicaceae bacterium]